VGAGFDVSVFLRNLILTLVPMILSLTVHEFAHAWSANRLGDPTPKDEGRLTLDPRAHVDLIGTIIVPAVATLMGGAAFIGWARPTPFNPFKFREGVPRRLGTVLVAAAGPMSNALLAVLAGGAIVLLARANIPLAHGPVPTPLGLLLGHTMQLNVGLAVFNLLPIPPLDGSRLLPKAFDRWMMPLERYGLGILVVVFLLVPSIGNVVFGVPFSLALGALERVLGMGG
jgi:Zn-dependent protease